MDSLGPLLLRVVLVPLGYLVAVVVGTLVIVFGSWRLGEAAAHPDAHVFVMFGFVFAAPVLLVTLLSLMWLPAAMAFSFRKPLPSAPFCITRATARSRPGSAGACSATSTIPASHSTNRCR